MYQQLKSNCVFAAVMLFSVSVGARETDSTKIRQAKETFERLKKFEGHWAGQSTKGWTDTLTYKTVAGGSVVVEESFGAHPNETMYSMFSLDVDRLIMTHYCVARNQPRLVATEFGKSDSGDVVVFNFLDITGAASRDKGHMDKCRVTFISDSLTKLQWTWYQDGQESWMEEILQKRVE